MHARFFSYSSSTTNWTEKKREIIFFYPKINLRNELQKSHTGKAWGQNEILAKFYTFIEKNESLVPYIYIVCNSFNKLTGEAIHLIQC